MTRKVLLDTNMLIGALEPEPGNEEHVKAKQQLASLLSDESVKLAITPLIRYEVLRGVRRVSLEEMEKNLNGFHEFEVRGVEASRAAKLFRLAKGKGLDFLNKRSFDLFHCVCAEANGLEILAQDGDIPKINQLIQDSK
jgi:predicted nucleic acid-binding protein